MKWRTGTLYRPEIEETKYHAVFDDADRIIAVTGLVGCECEPESIEHAKLIAAAPELLEAVETVARFYQDYFEIMPVAFESIAFILDAANAKAKGR